MSWSGWSSLGGSLDGNPAVGSNQNGRLEVFAVWNDGSLRHIWQTAPNGLWSSWAPLNGNLRSTSTPAVGRNRNGALIVFAVWNDGTLRRIEQTNGWSGGWQSMGGDLFSNPAVGSNQNGRLEVFAVWRDGTLQHMREL